MNLNKKFPLQSNTISICLIALTLLLAATSVDAQESKWVYPGVSGRLIYVPDAEADRIPDFSDVGYRQGREAIPSIPQRAAISPIAGDNTAHIQAAIDRVAAKPLQADGYRGSVRLRSGTYNIAGQLVINTSGIALRGSGRGDTGTHLRATGTDQRALIRIEGAGSKSFFGSKRNMIDKVVPVGSRSFRVNKPDDFAVGDQVRISRPAFSQWLSVIGMDAPGIDWASSSNHIRFDRIITRKEGDRLFVDAPLTNAFELEYGIGRIQKFVWPERIENIGIDNLSASTEFGGELTDDHARNFVVIDKAKNVFIRRVTTRHFSRSSVITDVDSKWVTIDRARNLEPKGPIDGNFRYAFELNGQQELVTGCRSYEGRHCYVSSDRRAPGPHVFHRSTARDAIEDSGPHNQWVNGILFDRIAIFGNQLNVRNRGTFGSGHGWSGANCVVFNSKASGGFIVQNPPTAQNWLIGAKGPVRNDETFGPQPRGYYDSLGDRIIDIPSLYEAQVEDAYEGSTRVEQRDYLFGDIDGFTYDGEGSEDDAYVDPVWALAIATSSSLPITGFDDLTANRNVAFTMEYELDPNDAVIHGSLSIALRKSGGVLNTDFIRLFTPDATYKFFLTDLGWDSEITADETFVGVIDLGMFLSELQDGVFDIQLNDDVAVDWAQLQLTVNPDSGN